MRQSALLKTVLPAALASIALLSFFSYQYQDEIKAKLPDIQVSLKDIEWSPFKATPTTPSTRNLVAGHWEQYTPLVDEVMLWKSNNCRIDWSDGWDKHDVQKEMDARAETVNGWQWVVDDGLPITNWTAEGFVERMVQSRTGLILIGDSLMEQMELALRNLISPKAAKGIPLITLKKQNSVWHGKGYGNRTDFIFNQNHPLYQNLQLKYIDIPQERFDMPLVTFVRTDILLTDDELAKVVLESGNETPVKWFFRSQGNWRAVLEECASREGWEGELPGFVVINTGAHWNPNYMAPASPEQIAAAYPGTLKLVSDTLSTFSSRIPLRSFYRSMSPAHDNCKSFHDPVTPSDPITTPSPNRYGWQNFPIFNEHAKNAFSDVYGGGLDKTAYWDIWSMSTVRPDAHAGYMGGVNSDCLHWCSPSVPEWWIRVFWNMIVEQTW